jgi:diacylglycerol kinase family enzyme
MAGAGLDARIVFEVNRRLKQHTGKLAYWAAGLAQITHSVEQFDVRIDGAVHRVGFLLASRIRNYGGDLEIATGASLLHDDFEVVLFEGSSPLRYALYMLGVLTRQAKKLPGVHVTHAHSVEILTPIHAQTDGEYAGREPLCLSIAPQPLTILLPPTYG